MRVSAKLSVLDKSRRSTSFHCPLSNFTFITVVHCHFLSLLQSFISSHSFHPCLGSLYACIVTQFGPCQIFCTELLLAQADIARLEMSASIPGTGHRPMAVRVHRLGDIPTSTFKHLVALFNEGHDSYTLRAWFDLVLQHRKLSPESYIISVVVANVC